MENILEILIHQQKAISLIENIFWKISQIIKSINPLRWLCKLQPKNNWLFVNLILYILFFSSLSAAAFHICIRCGISILIDTHV